MQRIHSAFRYLFLATLFPLNITGYAVETICDAPIQAMTFEYLGDNCSRSNNVQPSFECSDFNGGPLSAPGNTAYITAESSRGGVFFDSVVSVGEEFTLNANLEYNRLSADVIIRVFESEGGGFPLQSTKIHVSCEQILFLDSVFGANMVKGWLQVDLRRVPDNYSIE